ncbi:TetR/AcrR family transcriptional regulator [Bradyrhizobium sp.]|uniref:TetR/AcrR family transcriptional regulator n=1 Tax=Bradyrhizobium sp. TaxID=376 RepID=UPI000A4A5B88|nr:TetR/AcrR family transcriptional regulator [Bradyrhizobium sp.]
MARTADPQRHEAKRREMLHAARKCFAEKGFHSTSTAEICRMAGMSPGNLFHYFPTKDAIIQAIAEQDRRETAQLFASLDPEEDAIASVINLAEQTMLHLTDPLYAKLSLELAAEAMRNPAIAEMFAVNDRESSQALTALLRRGVERGEIDSGLDLDRSALWLIALVEGAIGRAAMDPGFDAGAHIDTLTKLISRFLAPRAPQAAHGGHAG